MSSFAIKAENLGKEYMLGGAEQQHESFREMLMGALSSPLKKFRRLSGNAADREHFWALKDLNFEIQPGEKVGVIGHNGAGKSTLLKVLSRITPPTTGQVQVQGRVSSLLEVGTGFHPELTGRENIFLNGSILGMTREQIRQRFDEIVAFAEVEKFIDTPVKRYSSGMYVRLAFSVAAHLDSDVLIVDEVLAVGDQRFQDKSLGKLDDMGKDGRTVMFVSHNLSMVSQLCSRTMLLEQGELIAFGSTEATINEYSKRRKQATGSHAKGFSGPLSRVVDVSKVSVLGHAAEQLVIVNPLEQLSIEVDLDITEDLAEARATVILVRNGTEIVSQHSAHVPELVKKGQHHFKFSFPNKFLSPGHYAVKFGVSDAATKRWIWGEHQAHFEVSEGWAQDYQPKESMGLVNFRDTAQHTFAEHSRSTNSPTVK